MKIASLKYFALITAVTTISIISCKKDDNNSTLQVRMTDGPTNLAEVNVDIKEISVKFSDDTSSTNGWMSMSTHAGVYNLLGLQNGVDTLLATLVVPQDMVKEIRFVLGPNNSIKDTLGVVYPLTIPSGEESGLKIKVNKKLSASLETLLIDFDAALSVYKTGTGEYKLKPVLKIK
jgi:hypothetical protein